MNPEEYNSILRRRSDHHTRYWTAFLEGMARVGDSPIELSLTREYIRYSLGDDDHFHVAAVLPIVEKGIRVEFSLRGRQKRRHFEWFSEHRQRIEDVLSDLSPLDWKNRNEPFSAQCQIGRTMSEHSPFDRAAWGEQHSILADGVRLLRETFRPLVRELRSDG